MRSLSFFLVWIFAIIFFAGTAESQKLTIFELAEAEQKKVGAALADCSEKTALEVTFEQLFDPSLDWFQANPKLKYKCVKFEGIASWRRVFKNDHSSYIMEKFGSRRANIFVREHIGLTGHDVMQSKKLSEKPVRGQIIGVLSTCGFTMGGYCHYEPGPHVVIKDIKGKPYERGFRYIGETAAQKYGNLIPISHSDAEKIGLKSAFYKWLNSIARKDESSFDQILKMSGGRNGIWKYVQFEDFLYAKSAKDLDKRYAGIWDAFFNEDSVYASIVVNGNYEVRFFNSTRMITDKGLLSNQPLRNDKFACACLEKKCDGRWPISSRDMGIGNSYPYVCKMFWKDSKGDKWLTRIPDIPHLFEVEEIEYVFD